ncbi:response regulator [Xanthomonas campestris]|uniref:response regulator n=1 Tax=Xanthomonas campestris TaxID=339 RepID=UPI001E4C4C1B|nr:response regulator [Xanthomonas campestris]MCC5064159.1 response regulator [Xanthomonas campestris pv. raphani]MEA9890067.1 response regulator [Xanthomonas campestris pv. raphani]MEA9975255.1 response regulator [Xanthomonas campestris pv. raphani]
MLANEDILVVEDDSFKLAMVLDFLRGIAPKARIRTATSYASARSEMSNPTRVVVLDMSLPSYDVRQGEPGGEAQGLVGLRLLHLMNDFCLDVPTIVLTQYTSHYDGERRVDLGDLRESLKNDFPHLVKGVIYYSSSSDEWRDEMRVVLTSISEGLL